MAVQLWKNGRGFSVQAPSLLFHLPHSQRGTQHTHRLTQNKTPTFHNGFNLLTTQTNRNSQDSKNKEHLMVTTIAAKYPYATSCQCGFSGEGKESALSKANLHKILHLDSQQIPRQWEGNKRINGLRVQSVLGKSCQCPS